MTDIIDMRGHVWEEKERFFNSGGVGYRNPTGRKDWIAEFSLCNCFTCGLYDCKARLKPERFPTDAGGDGQCIKCESHRQKYVFRNGDTTVITIPPQIVEIIKEDLKTSIIEELKNSL